MYPLAVRLGTARTVAKLGIHQQDAETILRKPDEIEAHKREQEIGRQAVVCPSPWPTV